MRKPFILGAALVAIVAVLASGGAYVYFFSGLRSTPKPLSLSTVTASPNASPSASISSAATGSSGAASLAGTWKVAQGSLAGYRVKEQFAGQTSTHDAVSRTSTISGSLTVQDAATGLTATGLQFTVRVADLQSVDQVAGFNVSQRDRIVSQSLSVSQYPDATFVAQSVAVPVSLESGQAQTLTIPGQLTVHGVTKPEQLSVQVQLNGSQVQAAGSTSFAMTDFAVQPPQVPITTVNPQVTVEFQLVLAKA